MTKGKKGEGEKGRNCVLLLSSCLLLLNSNLKVLLTCLYAVKTAVEVHHVEFAIGVFAE